MYTILYILERMSENCSSYKSEIWKDLQFIYLVIMPHSLPCCEGPYLGPGNINQYRMKGKVSASLESPQMPRILSWIPVGFCTVCCCVHTTRVSNILYVICFTKLMNMQTHRKTSPKLEGFASGTEGDLLSFILYCSIFFAWRSELAGLLQRCNPLQLTFHTHIFHSLSL
jgi:hypothetical protein